jgi:hypothetical protein
VFVAEVVAHYEDWHHPELECRKRGAAAAAAITPGQRAAAGLRAA